MTVIKGWQVTWMGSQNRGHVRSFGDYRKLCKFLDGLKVNATVRVCGEIVGGVQRLNGRWTWWVEKAGSLSLNSPPK